MYKKGKGKEDENVRIKYTSQDEVRHIRAVIEHETRRCKMTSQVNRSRKISDPSPLDIKALAGAALRGVLSLHGDAA